MRYEEILRTSYEIKSSRDYDQVKIDEDRNEYTLWVQDDGSYRLVDRRSDLQEALACATDYSDSHPDLLLLIKSPMHVLKLNKGKPDYDYFGAE